MALRDISRQRNNLVASGGEADIGYRAPLADSDANDPERPFASRTRAVGRKPSMYGARYLG